MSNDEQSSSRQDGASNNQENNTNFNPFAQSRDRIMQELHQHAVNLSMNQQPFVQHPAFASFFHNPAPNAAPNNPSMILQLLEPYRVHQPPAAISLQQIAASLLQHEASANNNLSQAQQVLPFTSVAHQHAASFPIQQTQHQSVPLPPPASNLSNPTITTEESSSRPKTTGEEEEEVFTEPELPDDGTGTILYLPSDEEHLSTYQCLVRKQIELFEATEEDLQDTSQGRNRPIILGQLGIRCRHCGRRPAKQRAKGGKFFPSNLDGLYQTAQNMANRHLLFDCRSIPVHIRQDLIVVRSREKGSKTCKSAYGSGRSYWSNCLRVQGVIPTEDRRLKFSEAVSSRKQEMDEAQKGEQEEPDQEEEEEAEESDSST